MDLQPPPLRHQECAGRMGIMDDYFDVLDDEMDDNVSSPQRYRSYPPNTDVELDQVLYRSAAPQDDEDDEDDGMPVYRSVSLQDLHDADLRSAYDGSARYHRGAGMMPWLPQSHGTAPHMVPDLRCITDMPFRCTWSMAEHELNCEPAAPGAAVAMAPKSFSFELPSEIFDAVLVLLPASPDLFNAMRVCSTWRNVARANYLSRVVTVPPNPEALLRAVDAASAGDTIRLQPGVYLLPTELTIDTPLRLVSDSEADFLLKPLEAARASVSAPLSAAALVARDDPPADYAPCCGDVVLVATLHVLLRTRCTALVAGITLCRMGDEIGYPNAVTYAEGGRLRMERCRVTCGGAAASVAQALQAFAEAPEPAGIRHAPWRKPGCFGGDTASSSSVTTSSAASSATACTATLADLEGSSRRSDADELNFEPDPAASNSSSAISSPLPAFASASPWPSATAAPSPLAAQSAPWPVAMPAAGDDISQCPQSGVWVGAAAAVELHGCTIAACMGPGIKIYRGRLLAQQNTIAFSSRGANVVANGGHVVLEGNDIKGANGDGVSSWNNSVMRIERNSIHANSGAGIAVNTAGGSVTISNNTVFNNACQAVVFARSTKATTMYGNDFNGTSMQTPSTEEQLVPSSSHGASGGSSSRDGSSGGSSSARQNIPSITRAASSRMF